ncbi:LysR substrate-binding domain-containing protein [Corynebacterium sp. HS2168-gen11]|uniref:LysR substrate-binding domain-containing protein n=1 Tax=Corynebacterium sp. HS2168-gen11 TaxID=2974027 RepID=UPI00216AE2A7|nr:LysR substrate-binding domain-containing protein [Corynebacterium sp. HS2168-gen11]MCS4534970.1 LysR substrate-binding domain-containing protein [Corynebacterium sp. HS2168-gen11]
MVSLSFVTGTEPDKWLRRFQQHTTHGSLATVSDDDAFGILLAGKVDMALTRIPDARIDERFHVVKLYDEQSGVALPKDHTLTLLDHLAAADLQDEIIHYQLPASGHVDIGAIRQYLQVVAANVGVVVAPRPLLKALSGKMIEHREYRGDQPITSIALVWLKEHDSDAIQDFVGIAKGRRPNSSRQAQPKRTAAQKAQEKKQRRQAVVRKINKPRAQQRSKRARGKR